MTTIPIFLHLQPIFAPLTIPEPPLLLDPKAKDSDPAAEAVAAQKDEKPKHLHFVLTLHDPVHNLRFTTVSQSVPGDWLEVEYDQSEWVEERLVDVIRVGVEIIAQDVSPIYIYNFQDLAACQSDDRPVADADHDIVRGYEDGIEAFCKDTADDAKVGRQESGIRNHRRFGSEERRLTIGMMSTVNPDWFRFLSQR